MATDPDLAGPPAKPAKKKRGGPLAKENRRLVAGTILGALAAAFALLNLDKVEVNWILGSGRTPLIIVIAVSFALGAGLSSLLTAKKKRKSPR